MKYTGEPLSHVVDYENGKGVFIFDINGECETKDAKLIEWMRTNKPHVKAVNDDVHGARHIQPINGPDIKTERKRDNRRRKNRDA